MSSVNWGSIATSITGISSILTSAGVSATALPGVLSGIGGALNPHKADELAICAQLLRFEDQPEIESKLAMQLATQQGIPEAAARMALKLTKPGADIDMIVMNIENIIRRGE